MKNDRFIITRKRIPVKEILLLLGLLLLFASCVSSKRYNELKAKNEQLESEKLALEEYIVELEEMEYIELRNDQSTYAEDLMDNYSFNFFYSIKSTDDISIDNFLKRDNSLSEENKRLVNALKKMDFDDNYKYFIAEGGYGIVTKPERIDKKGNVIKNNRWNTEVSNCSWFNILCSGKGYYRVYVFLIVRETAPMTIANVEMTKIVDEYKNLNGNWRLVPGIKELLENEENTANDYSLEVRVYEFVKEDLGGFSMLSSLTDSNLKTKIKEALGL